MSDNIAGMGRRELKRWAKDNDMYYSDAKAMRSDQRRQNAYNARVTNNIFPNDPYAPGSLPGTDMMSRYMNPEMGPGGASQSPMTAMADQMKMMMMFFQQMVQTKVMMNTIKDLFGIDSSEDSKKTGDTEKEIKDTEIKESNEFGATKELIHYKDGSYSQVEYKYDDKGKLSKEIKKNNDDNKGAFDNTEVTVYNADKTSTYTKYEGAQTSGDDFLVQKTYDKDGHVTSEKTNEEFTITKGLDDAEETNTKTQNIEKTYKYDKDEDESTLTSIKVGDNLYERKEVDDTIYYINDGKYYELDGDKLTQVEKPSE